MGLEYVDAVFQTIMDSSFASYTIGGMKALAVLFFLIPYWWPSRDSIGKRHRNLYHLAYKRSK